MTSTQKARLSRLVLVVLGVIAPLMMFLIGFSQHIQAYLTPGQLVRQGIETKAQVRLGAWVKIGSLKTSQTGVEFLAEDVDGTVIPVVFDGLLPSLFREGQLMVAEGRLKANKFVATRVLAKHDENYMPKQSKREG